METEDARVVRYLAVVPGLTLEQVSTACGVPDETVDALATRGFLVRRGDRYFASLTGVQEAMSGVSTLPEKLEWQKDE